MSELRVLPIENDTVKLKYNEIDSTKQLHHYDMLKSLSDRLSVADGLNHFALYHATEATCNLSFTFPQSKVPGYVKQKKNVQRKGADSIVAHLPALC